MHVEKLHLICLQRLISASADSIGCIRPTDICRMIELLHEL